MQIKKTNKLINKDYRLLNNRKCSKVTNYNKNCNNCKYQHKNHYNSTNYSTYQIIGNI